MLVSEHFPGLDEVCCVHSLDSHCSDFPAAKKEPSQTERWHRTFPPTFPTPWFLERQQHQPASCLSRLDVLVRSKKKTSSLGHWEAILAQGWSNQDLSFACHSPRCVNTGLGQQRGVLPGCGHSEINAATLLNRISYLFAWHLIVLNKGQCVLTALPFVLREREQLWLFSPSPGFQAPLYCSQVFRATFYEPTP